MTVPPAAPVQLGGQTTAGVTVTVAGILGVAVLAGVVAGCVALAYRWYVRERVPTGLPLLAGLAVVAVSLSTTTLLANEIAPDGPDIELVTALVHVAAFLTSGLAAVVATRFGDRLGVDIFAAGGANDVDADVSEIVQTVGRVTSVQLPEEIADVVGYDPVPEETKETLAGRRFLFPRRLTKTELRDRLVSRLKTDYGVGHVDVELGDDGSVAFLAVGSRAAGIGPTLPPATNAVAIRADPAHAASAGDLVQVWETDPMKRVLTGELRGVAGDVVTVAIDAADTPKLNPGERYKLVTLPVQDRPDREFASLLRAADESLATVTVETGSDLDGVALDALDVTVAAITREDGPPEPLPARSRTLQAGDVVYVVATPEILRKVENAAADPNSPVTGGDAGPGSADPEPESGNPGPVEPDSNPAESGPKPVDSGPTPAESENAVDATDRGEGFGDAAEPAPDQPPTEEPDSDDVAADADPLTGDAFVDTDDLPGMDSEIEAPTFSGDPPDDPAEDRDDAENDRQGDESDAADANASDASSGASGSIDDALDSMEPLDLDGPAEADAESGESGDDESAVDVEADDVFDGSTADEPFDESMDDEPFDESMDDDPFAGPAEDPLFDDALDDAATDEFRDETAGESGDDAAGESGDDADDESIPFTPLDVGDEDDPLADSLTGGDDDGAGRDDPERDGGN